MWKIYYIFWIFEFFWYLLIFDVSFGFVALQGPGGWPPAARATPVPRLGIDKPPLTSAIEAKRSARNRILASLGGRPHGRSKSLCRFGELFPRVPTTLYLAVHVFKCLQFYWYHVVSESFKSPNPDLLSRYPFCKSVWRVYDVWLLKIHSCQVWHCQHGSGESKYLINMNH